MSDIDRILHRDDLATILEQVLADGPKDVVIAWYDTGTTKAKFWWIGSQPMCFGLTELLRVSVSDFEDES
jgi:hypothetical protein